MNIRMLKKGLNVLTDRSMFGVRNELKLATEELHRASQSWMIDKGIQGVGIGNKEKDSEILPDLVIKVYVEKKLPKAKVKNLIPEILSLPGHEIPLRLDVVEIGRVKLNTNTQKVRPVMPGFSIGHSAATAGTLGCLVRKKGDPNGLYLLSSSHVLANHGLGVKGDAIIQPGKKDGGQLPGDKIAELFEWVPFDFQVDATANTVDAAIARVIDNSFVKDAIRKIGVPTGINLSPRLDMIIKKTGRTTDFTCGTIRDVNFRTRIQYKKTASTTQKIWMYDQVLCTRYGDHGDSGSILLTTSGKVVGLHMAGSDSISVFNKIKNVIKALDISIITT